MHSDSIGVNCVGVRIKKPLAGSHLLPSLLLEKLCIIRGLLEHFPVRMESVIEMC